MTRLQRRAELLARAERRLAIARLVDEIRARLRHVEVEASEAGVEVRGRRLVKRWIEDASLRFVGSLVR